MYTNAVKTQDKNSYYNIKTQKNNIQPKLGNSSSIKEWLTLNYHMGGHNNAIILAARCFDSLNGS